MPYDRYRRHGSEETLLGRGNQRPRIPSQAAKMIGEALGSMRAIDFARLHAIDELYEFVEVGVIGKRHGMVDSQPVLRARVRCPTGDGDRNRRRKPRQSKGLGVPGRRDDRMARNPVALVAVKAS